MPVNIIKLQTDTIFLVSINMLCTAINGDEQKQ